MRAAHSRPAISNDFGRRSFRAHTAFLWTVALLMRIRLKSTCTSMGLAMDATPPRYLHTMWPDEAY